MTYRIVALRNGEVSQRVVKRRSDAAELALERMVRGIVEGFGGLDTLQGHATVQRARDLDVTRGGTFTAYEYTVIVTASRIPPAGLGL
jgi:hypothetical protein